MNRLTSGPLSRAATSGTDSRSAGVHKGSLRDEPTRPRPSTESLPGAQINHSGSVSSQY
jgi:hypothetical protein